MAFKPPTPFKGWKLGKKKSIIEGICDEGQKCYPESSVKDLCCFVLVHHFMSGTGGVNPNEMHNFKPGKRYRITVEELD